MAKETIYGLSSGSYSDYRVDSIWASKKLAEEYLKEVERIENLGDGTRFNDEMVEEFPYYTEVPDLFERWTVYHMLEDGRRRANCSASHSPVSEEPEVKFNEFGRNVTATGPSREACEAALDQWLAGLTDERPY